MDEIKVSFFQYLPFIEFLWKEEIRPQLSFLTNNAKILDSIKQEFDLKKNTIQKPTISSLFLLNHGNLDWIFSNDIYPYFRKSKLLLFYDEPVRPIIPFSAKSNDWQLDSHLKVSTFNARTKISYYPSLCVEIKKNCSIKVNQIKEYNLDIQINSLKKIVYSQQLEEKMRIFRTLYTDHQDLSIELSDISIIMECTIDNYNELNPDKELLSLKRIPNIGWIDMDEQHTISVIYSNPKPSRKFRERVLKSISYAFLMKNLRTRINYLLDTRIDQQLIYRTKLDFLEYVVSVLNPEFYSSKLKKSYFFPFHYQRLMFSEVYNNLKEKGKYENILKELNEIMSSWESHELCGLLLRNNMVTNILRRLYSNAKLNIQPPPLNDRKKALVGFLKNEFINQLERDGLQSHYIKERKYYAGRSANYFRDYLRKWMKGKYDPSIISMKELKETPIAVLESLYLDGLIKITYIEKTSTKLLYSLNLDNPFIQKILFEGWEVDIRKT
ncbi:MAG: hypothetical protein ACTSPO_15065 [Candidatus Heimdallarchaeaceae archaeon]